jgi:thioredoxin reductase
VAERFGSTVLHCPYCHGWEVRDQPIGVIATGVLAEHAAKLWTQWSRDVILFANGRPVGDDGGRYRVVEGPVDRVDDRGVHLADGRLVERSALVVQTRVEARAAFLAELGLKPVDLEMQGASVATYVPADPTGRTDVDGVWVAGNVTDPMGQVITAAAAGMKAGAMLNMDLIG